MNKVNQFILGVVICTALIGSLLGSLNAAENNIINEGKDDQELLTFFRRALNTISDKDKSKTEKLNLFLNVEKNAKNPYVNRSIETLAQRDRLEIVGWARIDRGFAVAAVIDKANLKTIDLDPVFFMRENGEWKIFPRLTIWRGEQLDDKQAAILESLLKEFKLMKTDYE